MVSGHFAGELGPVAPGRRRGSRVRPFAKAREKGLPAVDARYGARLAPRIGPAGRSHGRRFGSLSLNCWGNGPGTATVRGRLAGRAQLGRRRHRDRPAERRPAERAGRHDAESRGPGGRLSVESFPLGVESEHIRQRASTDAAYGRWPQFAGRYDVDPGRHDARPSTGWTTRRGSPGDWGRSNDSGRHTPTSGGRSRTSRSGPRAGRRSPPIERAAECREATSAAVEPIMYRRRP